MRAPDGRAFTRTGQQKVNRELQKSTGILSRRSVAMPKATPQPQPAPSGALSWVLAESYEVTSDSRGYAFTAWDLPSMDGPQLAISKEDGAFFGPTQAGFYSMKVEAWLNFTGTPAADIELYLNNSSGSGYSHAEFRSWRSPRATYHDCVATHTFYLPAPSGPRAPLSVYVRAENGSALPGVGSVLCEVRLTRHG